MHINVEHVPGNHRQSNGTTSECCADSKEYVSKLLVPQIAVKIYEHINFHHRSDLGCAQRCTSDPICQAFGYLRTNLTCGISSKLPTDEELAANGPLTLHVRENPSELNVRIKLNVSMLSN